MKWETKTSSYGQINSGSTSSPERWEESVPPKIELSKIDSILEISMQYIKQNKTCIWENTPTVNFFI